MNIGNTKLYWWSDWKGEEVGYDTPFVGLYSLKDFPEIYIYIDTATGKILEAWAETEN